jgi:hypothetical protein
MEEKNGSRPKGLSVVLALDVSTHRPDGFEVARVETVGLDIFFFFPPLATGIGLHFFFLFSAKVMDKATFSTFGPKSFI